MSNIPFLSIKKKIILNYPKSATMGFHLFQGTKERAQDGHGKRAISVRAIEVLLYYIYVKVTGVIIVHSSSQEILCWLFKNRGNVRKFLSFLWEPCEKLDNEY